MTDTSSACLQLPADCSMRAMRQLAEEAKVQVFAKGAGDLTLDCAQVVACDLTLVQLLASAQATLAKQGRHLALANVPQSVETAFSRSGVAWTEAGAGLGSGAH